MEISNSGQPTGWQKYALTRLGTIDPVEMEEQYRRALLREDLSRVKIIILVAVAAAVLLASSDYQLFGAGPRFFQLLAVRVVLVVFSLLAIIGLRHWVTTKALDRIALAWSLGLCAAMILVNLTRPVEYMGTALFDVLVIVLAYCALPLPLRFQIIPAGLITVASIAHCASGLIDANPIGATAVVVSAVIANLIGLMISRELHGWKRRQFLTQVRESKLRAGLEASLAEIRTLRGILPICSYCKRIRDEGGDWQPLEEYVRARTHADFSHGICPTCMVENHPEVLASGDR